MKVMVAGASGIVGRRMLPRLAAAGHRVVALVGPGRDPADGPAADEVVAVDALDGPAVAEVVLQHRPDVLVHQLTRLPRSLAGADFAAYSAANARLRTVGTANLVAAATAAGTPRMVAQSLAFAYAPVGPMVVAEDAPLHLDAPEPWATTVAAVAELERLVLHQFEGAGTVLRYGSFYGPGTWWASDGDHTAEVRAGTFLLVGNGVGVTSFLHVDDAAAAACLAVDAGRPGVFNIADDEPAPSATWVPQVAAQLHAPPPRWVSDEDGLKRFGWRLVHQLTEQRGADTRAAREALGFVPSHPTWRHDLGLDPALPSPGLRESVRPGPSRAPRGRAAS